MLTDLQIFLLVLVVAFGLLLLDRRVRIQPFLERQGFLVGSGAQRCGVEMAPCPHPLRCMNGFCRSQEVPPLKEVAPLPVLP